MPRQARLDFEGCLHHLINRGIERRKIFSDKNDYQAFIEQLGELVQKGGHKCHGWVLMPNHFHLMVETGREPVSKFMSRLLTRYAGYYNRRHRRSGRLFQNRYKSIVCDGETYFKALVAYIHLNPLRAGLVDSLKALAVYPYSGHQALLGEVERGWQSVAETLAHFGHEAGEARRRYVDFMAEKKDLKPSDLAGGGLFRNAGGLHVAAGQGLDESERYDSRILGKGPFVEGVLAQVEKRPKMKEKPTFATVEDLLQRAADLWGVEGGEITRPGKSSRTGASVRAMVTYLASIHLKTPLTAVAEMFGISQPAASSLFWKGEKACRDRPDLEGKLVGNIVI